MSISFQGIGEQVVTFAAATPAPAVGRPVSVTAAGTVSACANGGKFCGIARSVSGGTVAVQTAGYVELPYSGTAPALGYALLVGDGASGVKTAASNARELLVVKVDTTNSVVGLFL